MNTSRVPRRTPALTRRGFLLGAASLGGAAVLSSCVGSGGTTQNGTSNSNGNGNGSGNGAQPTTLTLQSSIQDEGPKAALEDVVAAFEEYDTTLNSVATEQFRAQLSTYLSSANPPDVLAWYAGSVANSYAEEGLLLDVSDLWQGDGACANFSEALRNLSTSSDGNQIFVPTNYYWWSIFYKKSAFESWGVEPVATWEEFLAMCDNLQGQGVYPLTNGIGPTPWMASGWFDYLNLRINGADYHRELLAGERSFEDSEVVEVMEQYARLIPYFHPNMTSWDAQQAATPVAQDEAAMYLVGAFTTQYFPEEQREDLDFFSVPTLDPNVPSAEEAPTDGFFAAANSANPQGAKDLLSYLASAEVQQEYIAKSGSSNLPTHPDVDTSGFTPLVQKGIELLNTTDQITQFFNRDSSDALQATADTALTRFLADPSDIPGILADWQVAAQQVFES